MLCVWLPGHSGWTEDWDVGGHGSRRGKPKVRVMFPPSVKFSWEHSNGDSTQSNSAMCFHLHSGLSMQQCITHVNDNLVWDKPVILLELCSSSQRWARERFLSCCSVQLFATPWTVARQVPLSMGFPRQEYWSGLPFPSPGNLPDPGIEPSSFMSPTLAGGFFTSNATWEALFS